MNKFVELTAIAAPILRINIDTDAIIPSREMKRVSKQGLGEGLFAGWRYKEPGGRDENADFILNQSPYRDAQILLSGANFGCGSSREHAVWALAEWGIRAIIAPSFGAIFYGNCVRNGILPITLPDRLVRDLMPLAKDGLALTIDLENQKVITSKNEAFGFDIPPERKLALINGWDETAQILNQKADDIDDFEAWQRQDQPWLYETETAR